MQTHWHRETEIICVRSGRLQLYLDGAELLAEEGDVLTIGSGVIHSGNPEKCVYECIVFDPQALTPHIESIAQAIRFLIRNNIYIKKSVIAADPEFSDALEALFGICKDGLIERELELLGTMFRFIAGEKRNIAKARMDMVSERVWQHAERLKPALEYIRANYTKRVSLETLAKLSGFSPRYFCRYFRTIVHRSPIDYLNAYRAECAAHYLAYTEMNVAEVAALCGYADSSTFIKQFRKYMRITPKQYKMRL